MKINHIKYSILAIICLIFAACDPIVDEKTLSDNIKTEDVQLNVSHSTPGGNKITLTMDSPGVTGYWDYNLGKGLSNSVTIVYPIPGTSTFTFVGTLGSKFFTKTIDVQIDQLDTPLDPAYYNLVSDDTSNGKTWVFDGVAGSGRLFWFMSPPNDPASAMSAWWNAGDCCGPSDQLGKMHFDLDGAANYYHYETANATPTKGSFILDPKAKTLTILNSKMLGYAAGNADGVYNIISLTEDKMVLYLNLDKANETGWTFVFKAVTEE